MSGVGLYAQQHVGEVLPGGDAAGLADGYQCVEAGEILPRSLVADRNYRQTLETLRTAPSPERRCGIVRAHSEITWP